MSAVPRVSPQNERAAGLAGERADLYRRMDKHHLAPLWEVLHALVPLEPQTPCVPALWKYSEARPYVMESGKLITAKEAIRRVIVLENPGMRGKSCITNSLYCGLQLILPGEIAPSHRHTQSALRFIVEGSGSYTAVDGERTTMHPGDFIITPAWTWHDHGNPGNEAVVWMDGLDIQILQFFGAQFSENYSRSAASDQARGRFEHRYGHNLAPLDYTPSGKTSPIFSYPYVRSRETLCVAFGSQDRTLPRLGRCSSSTRSPAATRCRPSAASSSCCPRFARATARPTARSGRWSRAGHGEDRHRVLCVRAARHFRRAAWYPVRFETDGEEAVLFSFSDRPAQVALGLWREKRG